VRYILLLDPRKPVTPDPNNIGITVPAPFFRHWDADRRLREHPAISSTRVRSFRGDIYNSAGIKPGELNVSINTTLNLSDFRASVIRNGAFKIELTRDPSLHLRFDEDNEMRPTLHILDTRTVSMLALLDLTGFMSYIPIPEDADLLDQLSYPHSLRNSLTLTPYSSEDLPRHWKSLHLNSRGSTCLSFANIIRSGQVVSLPLISPTFLFTDLVFKVFINE
jgi:hypothetical protein